jgi:hypothetical protein
VLVATSTGPTERMRRSVTVALPVRLDKNNLIYWKLVLVATSTGPTERMRRSITVALPVRVDKNNLIY